MQAKYIKIFDCWATYFIPLETSNQSNHLVMQVWPAEASGICFFKFSTCLNCQEVEGKPKVSGWPQQTWSQASWANIQQTNSCLHWQKKTMVLDSGCLLCFSGIRTLAPYKPSKLNMCCKSILKCLWKTTDKCPCCVFSCKEKIKTRNL